MWSKREISLLIIFIAIISSTFGQELPVIDKLRGCWMELGNSELSYESIFIFNTADDGSINGMAYFYDSEDEALEYTISAIELSGDTLMFIIDNTSIYFEGLLNSSLDGFNGELVLANNTRLAVSHQKVDPATFKKIMPQGRLFDEKTIKKTIDANDGIEIGWAPRHSLGGARIDARPCIYTLRQNQTQLRIKNLYATQLPEDSIT